MQNTRNIRHSARHDPDGSPYWMRSDTDPMIGEVLGKYRIVDKLGRGGMAEVYRAEHVLIGGQFAVKVLLGAVSQNHSMIQRLFNEAKITATIEHPGIVKTFDFGYHTHGRAYLVMEYLKGETLNDRLYRDQTLPVTTALGYARQITSALKAAHAAGIIHRDLKPANVFLVDDVEVPGGQRARLLDFGIAKAELSPGQERVTQAGFVIGTPDYMSPEQCRAEDDIDHRSDLYSLGCILFRMLVGRRPFGDSGDDDEDLYESHLYAQPPEPRALAPDIPPPVSDLILRLLAKDPAHRFADADELLAALDHIGAMLPGDAPGVPYARALSSLGFPAGAVAGSALPGAETTLSGASASVTRMPAVRRSYWKYGLLAAGVAALVALVALGAGTWGDAPAFAQDEQAASAGAQDTGATARADGPDVTARPDVPAAGADDAGPALGASPEAPPRVPIWITIDSDPPGAEVFQQPDSVRLGVTPVSFEREPMDGELVFTVRKEGFQDYSVVADAADAGWYTAELVPARAAAPADEARPARSPRRPKRTRPPRRRGPPDKPGDTRTAPPADDTSNTVTLDPFQK